LKPLIEASPTEIAEDIQHFFAQEEKAAVDFEK